MVTARSCKLYNVSFYDIKKLLSEKNSPRPSIANRISQSWALEVFWNFFNNKKLFCCIFYQGLFLHQSYSKI